MTAFQKSYLTLSEVMAGWDNRYRTQQSLVWAPRGLAIGLGAALVVALAARFFPLFDVPTLLIISGAAALAGLLVALLGVWVWPRPPLKMARQFDAVFGLRERMSTAVELTQGRLPVQSDALARSQLSDALGRAGRVKPADGLPLALSRRDALLVTALLAALVAALILPNPQIAALKERQAVQAAIDEELEQLETLREEIANDPTLSQEDREAIAETLDDSIASLERRDVSREEAVAALAAAEEGLREISEQAGSQAQQNEQVLRDAGATFSTGGLTEELGQALQEGDFETAADLMDDILDPDGEPLTPEEQQALQQELAQAADQVRESDPALADRLQAASDAVGTGDQATAQQAMSAASQQLAQSGQQVAQDQASGQAAAQAAQQARQGQQSVAQSGQGQGQGQGQQPGQGQQGQQGAGGQGQQGQGQAQGQGAGAGQQGQQPGSGGAGVGPGFGEAQGGQISGQMPTDNDPQRDPEREYESIYAPQHVGGEGGPVVGLPGQGDPSRDPVSEGDFVENPAGQAQVPYSQVYADYAGAANEAVESERVPLGMRGVVRDYFSSLDPDR